MADTRSLEGALQEAVERTRELPVGSVVSACDFGGRDDGTWWWYVSAQQYHRLGNTKASEDPERDQTAENVAAVMARALEIAREVAHEERS